MSAWILTIRPEPGSTASVEAGRRAGVTIDACPLFEIRPLAWDPPPAEAFDALLIGSANAVRHAGPPLDAYREKPVYAVGPATAAAVKEAGLAVAAVGPGELQPLLDRSARAPLRLLRLAGEEHVSVTPPEGVSIEFRAVYRSVALPLPGTVAERLREGALVLLHSAVAARHFAAECDRCEVRRAAVRLAALGARIAAAAGPGWQEVRSASEPSEAALLALARDMCHETPPR